jgi:hypothetical protein
MDEVQRATESEPIAVSHARVGLPRRTGTESDQQTPDARVLGAAGQSDSTTVTVLIPSFTFRSRDGDHPHNLARYGQTTHQVLQWVLDMSLSSSQV